MYMSGFPKSLVGPVCHRVLITYVFILLCIYSCLLVKYNSYICIFEKGLIYCPQQSEIDMLDRLSDDAPCSGPFSE